MAAQSEKKAHVGVWIDHRQALIVRLQGQQSQVQHVYSEIESKHRSTGGALGARPFNHRTVASANRAESRRKHEIQEFYREVMREIGAYHDLIVLGPGQAKLGLLKLLLAHMTKSSLVAIPRMETTSSRMSEAQIVAHIKSHFGHDAPRRPVGATRPAAMRSREAAPH